MGSSQSLLANGLTQVSSRGLDSLDAAFTAAGAVPGDVPGQTDKDNDVCARQLQAAFKALKMQHWTALGLTALPTPEELVSTDAVKKCSAWLVVADLRGWCEPLGEASANEVKIELPSHATVTSITTTTRVLFKQRVKKVATTIARILGNEVRGCAMLCPIVDNVDHWDEIVQSLTAALARTKLVVPPTLVKTEEIQDFVSRVNALKDAGFPSAAMTVVCLPPSEASRRAYSVGADVPLIGQLASLFDATVSDALSAAFLFHPVLRSLPATIGPVAYGELSSTVLHCIRRVVVPPPELGARRVLLCGWIALETGQVLPFADAIGFNINRLDHLCASFDLIGLIGHPPAEASDVVNSLLLACERRGVVLWRATDCAVVDSAGQLVNVPVGPQDPWPSQSEALGLGSGSVASLQRMLTAPVPNGLVLPVHVTIVGTWSLIGPAVGLRSVVSACTVPGSTVTFISESDNMALRTEPRPPASNQTAAAPSSQPDPVLKRLPFGFPADVRNSLLHPVDGFRWLCGEAPPKL